MLCAIFAQFVEESPVSVMVRGLMERVFAPAQINRIFEDNAKVQYTRELLFSSLVELMSWRCMWNPSIRQRGISSQSATAKCQPDRGLRQTQRC